MEVMVVGDSLQVLFHELPVSAVVRVTVWKRGDERQVRVLFVLLTSFFILSFFSLLLPSSNYLYQKFERFFCFSSRSVSHQAAVYTMSSEQTTLTVAALQEGEVYCVRAQTVLDTHTQLNSSGSSDAHCVTITGTHTNTHGW